MDPRVLLERLANGRGLVGRDVVENDVDLLPRHTQGDEFLQETDELPTETWSAACMRPITPDRAVTER
jgi:hypothetical protein